MSRWITIRVDALDNPILDVGPYDRRSAWDWLYKNAAWKKHHVRTRGGLVDLKRGQVLAGREFLAKKWSWSVKKVRTFLKELEANEMIKTEPKKGQYANVISICNYDELQGFDKSEGQRGASERTVQGPAEGQRGASEGPYSTQGYTQDSTQVSTKINKQQCVRAQESESAGGDAPPPDSDLKNLDSPDAKTDAARHAKSLSVNQQTFEMCVQVHGEKTTSEALLRMASRIHDGQKIAKPSVLLPRICEDVAKEPRKTHYPSLATLHGVKLPNGRILSRFG